MLNLEPKNDSYPHTKAEQFIMEEKDLAAKGTELLLNSMGSQLPILHGFQQQQQSNNNNLNVNKYSGALAYDNAPAPSSMSYSFSNSFEGAIPGLFSGLSADDIQISESGNNNNNGPTMLSKRDILKRMRSDSARNRSFNDRDKKKPLTDEQNASSSSSSDYFFQSNNSLNPSNEGADALLSLSSAAGGGGNTGSTSSNMAEYGLFPEPFSSMNESTGANSSNDLSSNTNYSNSNLSSLNKPPLLRNNSFGFTSWMKELDPSQQQQQLSSNSFNPSLMNQQPLGVSQTTSSALLEALGLNPGELSSDFHISAPYMNPSPYGYIPQPIAQPMYNPYTSGRVMQNPLQQQYMKTNYGAASLPYLNTSLAPTSTNSVTDTSSILSEPLTPKTDGTGNDNILSRRAKKWSQGEDARLLEAVNKFGEGNWKKISEYVGTKSNTQCLQRYRRGLKPKPGHFTHTEDEIIIKLVKEQLGESLGDLGDIYAESRKVDWNIVVKNGLPERSTRQVRDRWMSNLSPSLNKANFTKDEDDLIVNMQLQMGNAWSTIARSFPGRHQDAVKGRYFIACRRITRAFTPDMDEQLKQIIEEVG